MSEQPNNPSDSLERLLSRWGADRAVRQTPLPVMPAGRGRRPIVLVLRRWAPLAAAAVLFIVSGVMFFGGPWRHQAREAVTMAPASPARESGGYQARPAEAEEPAGWRARGGGEDIDDGRSYAELREERDALAEEVDALQKIVKEMAETRAPLPAAAMPVAAAEPSVDETGFDHSGRSSEADRDVGGVSSLGYVDGFSAGERGRDLTTTAGLPSSDGPTMVRVYLSMVAPEEAGLSAVQTAVRKRHLLERCNGLQRRFADTEHQGLLDRVEVVLTQAEMVDGNDRRQVAGLVLLSRAGALRAALADALAEIDDTELREFLFEVQIIMEAVDGVA